MIPFDKIPPAEVCWLWPDYVPLGRLVPLIGDGGVGKGYIAVDLAARVSRGGSMPDDTPNAFGPGDVFILESEDGAGDTLRKRLEQQGADLTRVHLVHVAEGTGALNLSGDLDEIKAALSGSANPRLLIVSALNDYLPPGVNPDKYIEVRRVLNPLRAFAEQCGVAVLAILHIGKATDRKAQHRALGSVAYVNVPRVALGVVARASAGNGPTEGIFGGLKNNLGKLGASLRYGISGGGLRWDGPSPIDVKTAMQTDDGRSPLLRGPGRPPDSLNRAKVFLSDHLSGKPKGVPAGHMRQLATEYEIPETTLWRARKELGVTVVRRPDQGESWVIPAAGSGGKTDGPSERGILEEDSTTIQNS